MRRFQLACAAAALPLLLGACSDGPTTSPALPGSVSSSPPASNAGSSGAGATLSLDTPTAAVPDPAALAEEGDYPAPAPSPTWDPAARTAATEHAGATMAAFARPDLPGQQWWADLSPLLSLDAQDAYSAVDPAQVPPHRVTGEPVLTDDSSAWLAWVDVPTDVGTYALLLVRTGAGEPWRTQTITPPAELSEPAGR